MQPQTFPFPVVSPVSLDYRSGVKYEGLLSSRDSNITITHKISDDNIIAYLLKNGYAKFGCMVSLPATMYRRLFIDDSKSLNVVQKINYNESGAHEDIQHPMFRPVIIMTEEYPISNPDKAHGFHDIWLKQDIKFPQGGIIGFDGWMILGDAASSILQFIKDKDIPEGMIKVESDDTGGFRFKVLVHESLFTFISNPYDENEKNHVRSIWIHALSRGLEILATDYKNKDDWEQYPNLKLLEQQLKNEGQHHWDEEGFYPEAVATSLYPHIPSINRSEVDEY